MCKESLQGGRGTVLESCGTSEAHWGDMHRGSGEAGSGPVI